VHIIRTENDHLYNETTMKPFKIMSAILMLNNKVKNKKSDILTA